MNLSYFLIKISALIQMKKIHLCLGMSETEIYHKAEFVRRANFPKCGLNTRYDNCEVTLHLTFAL